MPCTVGCRLRGYEHPVVCVTPLAVLLYLLVQLGEPFSNEMDVLQREIRQLSTVCMELCICKIDLTSAVTHLQDDPVAILGAQIHSTLCHHFLTLYRINHSVQAWKKQTYVHV